MSVETIEINSKSVDLKILLLKSFTHKLFEQNDTTSSYLDQIILNTRKKIDLKINGNIR
jgi:hypothetical protein